MKGKEEIFFWNRLFHKKKDELCIQEGKKKALTTTVLIMLIISTNGKIEQERTVAATDLKIPKTRSTTNTHTHKIGTKDQWAPVMTVMMMMMTRLSKKKDQKVATGAPSISQDSIYIAYIIVSEKNVYIFFYTKTMQYLVQTFRTCVSLDELI